MSLRQNNANLWAMMQSRNKAIRERLVEDLGKLDRNSELGDNIRSMQKSCREFLTTITKGGGEIVIIKQVWEFRRHSNIKNKLLKIQANIYQPHQLE